MILSSSKIKYRPAAQRMICCLRESEKKAGGVYERGSYFIYSISWYFTWSSDGISDEKGDCTAGGKSPAWICGGRHDCGVGLVTSDAVD